MQVREYRRQLDRSLANWGVAASQVADETAALAAAKEQEQAQANAQKLVQTAAEAAQRTAHEQIAATVSRCLETVFQEEAYQFRVIFEQKRGKTEARAVFVRNDRELDPITECGQGTVDVAAFALQLVSLIMSKPPRRRLLVLDEPFQQLHGKEWRERIRGMLKGLAEELNIQMLIMTQDDTDLRLGKVYEL